MTPRVIVTYARSWYSLSAIRSLGRRGIEVIAADVVSPTPGSLSRYSTGSFTYASAEESEEAFIDGLAAAIDEFRPAAGEPYVLLPMHRETYAVAKYRDRLPKGIAVPLADSEIIERVRHKGKLVALAKEHGVTIPATRVPHADDELGAILSEATYPVFIKLPTGAGGVGLARADDPREARAEYVKLAATGGQPLIQEAVPGDDYCVSCLFDRGEMVTSLVYRNRLNFPSDGGPGAVRESVRAPGLVEISRRFLSELAWHGIAQVDFRWSGDEGDEPALIEINPRFFSGLPHAISAGVDYPYYLYQIAIGESPTPGPADLELVSEAPITGFLATIADLAELASPELIEEIKAAWEKEKNDTEPLWRRAIDFVSTAVGVARETALDRVEQIREAIVAYGTNESSLEADDDPLPLVGLLYPLVMFIREGTLDSGKLTGVGGGD